MFLTCNICKHSVAFPQSEGASSPDLFKCRKEIPTLAQGDQPGVFPVVEADWECNKYQREMIGG